MTGYKNSNANNGDDWDIRYIQKMYDETLKYFESDEHKLSLANHYMHQFKSIVEPKLEYDISDHR